MLSSVETALNNNLYRYIYILYTKQSLFVINNNILINCRIKIEQNHKSPSHERHGGNDNSFSECILHNILIKLK